ncbi:MAG TPA: serine hydrolase [Pyrinomonadaceae bacterium]|jgi:CubicO group peptidase (beta-lactamase class C family)
MKLERFFLPLSLAISLFLPVARPAAQEGGAAEARRARVERGLLPPVLLKGAPAWTIEERMRHYKIPGVSVAVIKDFKVEWARGYGFKDAEAREPVTERTLFQAGSISKPVAAMTVLKKVEQGKLSLDEDVNAKLVSWKLPENEFTAKKKVTLANLLSHTAGLTVHGFPGYAAGEKLPTVPQVLDGAAPANTAPVRVDLEPGTRFRYSGGGTTVAQLLLTDVERRPFPDIARETVLRPLGMDDSGYEQPLPAARARLAATGYRGDGRPVEGKFHVYPEMAAAGLWTTPTDLAKFGIEVQLSLQGKSNKVLSKATAERMVTPFVGADNGLGFFVQKRGQQLYFGHDGADEGFRAQLLVHREKGYGAVVMVNSDNGQIIGEIFRAVAREYGWDEFLPPEVETVSVAPERLASYAGRYLFNPDRVLNVTAEGGRLFVEPTQGSKVELFPVSETTFVRLDTPVRATFVPAAGDAPAKVLLVGPNNTSESPRLSDAAPIPYELLQAGKADEAVAAYRRIKKEKPDNAAVSEQRLNLLGYELLRAGRLRESVAVFALNAELYPQSFNVYDSLADAYAQSGDREQAVKNYRRSLELNPKNDNAARMLKKLEGEKQ